MSSIWTLRRSTADGKVAGVCSGLAHHADVDPLLVRVGAVLLALSGGIGLVAYLAAWLFVRDEHGTAPIDQHLPAARRWPRPLLIAALVVCCLVVGGLLSPILPFGFGSALVLGAIWYFGYYKNRPRAADTASPATEPTAVGAPQAGLGYAPFTGPPSAFTEAAAAWQRRMAEVQHPVPPAATSDPVPAPFPAYVPAPAPASTRPDVPAAERHREAFLAVPDPVGLYVDPPAPTTIAPHRRPPARRLRLVSVAVLGLTLAGLGVADAFGVPIGVTTYLAAALLVGGLTLIAAARFGRARGLLPVTVLVALAALASSAAAAAPLANVGQRDLSYTAQSAIPAADHLSGGDLRVDLADLPVTRDQAYEVSVDYGQLELVRPTASNVRILWSVGEGVVTGVDDETRHGENLSGTIEPTGVEPGDPVLTITLRVDHGRLEVRR